MTIFDCACFRIVPKIGNHKPDERDQKGFTVAMILAMVGVDIPKEWEHDPNIHGPNGTIATLLAENGKIPGKQWQHNKFIRVMQCDSIMCFDYKYCTVQNLLQEQNIEVPEEWKYDNVVDDYDNTQAMIQARNEQIPDQQYYHDPKQTNMNNETVAQILARKGIVPPPQWMIAEDQNKQIFKQIYENLRKYCYIYVNGQFIFNVKTVAENDVCQICLTNEKQEFIKTKCGHKTCLQCFRQMLKQNQQNLCPICKQSKWFEQIK